MVAIEGAAEADWWTASAEKSMLMTRCGHSAGPNPALQQTTDLTLANP
jgi:hypothetical protein